ncbi:ketoacyl-ACP synthase III [Marinilongibacter aquaticus]|uniref:ketoacyl-ACP synthase III n=1 Tax=Marinilongibacter aquaticus TaxID=2975157 RepID=UPI0021BDC97D|nr:ketoacyl-ACP synthase III [Marinilongibacter aquaticus]UBM57665.1 ketoacyl-ACP synthase III [Marinilongibacter aquaticus]
MNTAYLKAVSYYLPERVMTNAELVREFPEWTVEKVAKKVGIDQRHISAEDEFVSDMAVKAAEKLFEEHKIDRNVVDFVMLCTQSPDYFLPTTACIVQDRLGLPTSAGAIDYNQGCSGYVYGLAMAKGLVSAGIAQNILLITSEVYSKHIHKSDKGNRTIFGDAASASLISTEGLAEIGQFELGSDGSGFENLIVKNGAMKSPKKSAAEAEDMDDFLYMNGSAIFNFTIDAVPGLVENTLKKNGVSEVDEMDWFVFHQANAFMLNHLRKRVGIDSEQFLMHMQACGNTVSATLPIVLKNHWERFRSGQKVMLVGFGVGYSWGGTVLSFK